LAKVKNFKNEKETVAIAKTPGHRKKTHFRQKCFRLVGRCMTRM